MKRVKKEMIKGSSHLFCGLIFFVKLLQSLQWFLFCEHTEKNCSCFGEEKRIRLGLSGANLLTSWPPLAREEYQPKCLNMMTATQDAATTNSESWWWLLWHDDSNTGCTTNYMVWIQNLPRCQDVTTRSKRVLAKPVNENPMQSPRVPPTALIVATKS